MEPKLASIWVCPYCNTEYDHKKNAIKCIKKCKEKIKLETIAQRWSKLFCKYHKNNTRFRKYCVDCGILLLEWQPDSDYDSPNRGELIFEDERAKELLGGLRCDKCNIKFRLMLMEAVEYYKKHKEIR